VGDLSDIGRSLGWSRQEVVDFVLGIDPNHDGKISQEEFREIMRALETRISGGFEGGS